MTIKYVRSGAVGTADGSSWTNAYTTLAAAISGSGNPIYVAHDHDENNAAAIILNFVGSASAPIIVICVSTAQAYSSPPTVAQLATTGVVRTTGNFGINIDGYVYIYGLNLKSSSDGGSNSLGSINLAYTASPAGILLNNCTLQVLSTNGSASLGIGPSISGSNDDIYVRLQNTPVSFGATGQSMRPKNARIEWIETADGIAGSNVPSTLIGPTQGAPFYMLIQNVGLQAVGTGKNLVLANVAVPALVRFVNCKLGSSWTTLSGAIRSNGGVKVKLENCNSGDVENYFEDRQYQGSVITDNAVYRTGKGSDGTTPYSMKITSLTTGPTFAFPLVSPPLVVWNSALTSKTVTVEFVHDSATDLKDDEIYCTVEYLGTSGYPISTVDYSDRVAEWPASLVNGTGNGTAQAAGVGTGSWTGIGGMANARSQKCSATITAAEVGYYLVRVFLAKSSHTVYLDPYLEIS